MNLNLKIKPISEDLRNKKEKLVNEMIELDKQAKIIEDKIGMKIISRSGIYFTIK